MKQYIKRQKLIKVGNSYAVTLDKEFVNQVDLSQVHDVTVVYTPDAGTVSMAKNHTNMPDSTRVVSEQKAVLYGKISPELQKWTDEFLSSHAEALEKLSHA